METSEEVLKRGAKEGVFREGVDPIDLYISISALSAYYIAHRHTFEYIFKTKLMTPKRLKQRVTHVADMIVRYLKVEPERGQRRCASFPRGSPGREERWRAWAQAAAVSVPQ